MVPFMKATVPPGVPRAEVTVAVKVMLAPRLALAAEVVSMVAVGMSVTVTVVDAEVDPE